MDSCPNSAACSCDINQSPQLEACRAGLQSPTHLSPVACPLRIRHVDVPAPPPLGARPTLPPPLLLCHLCVPLGAALPTLAALLGAAIVVLPPRRPPAPPLLVPPVAAAPLLPPALAVLLLVPLLLLLLLLLPAAGALLPAAARAAAGGDPQAAGGHAVRGFGVVHGGDAEDEGDGRACRAVGAHAAAGNQFMKQQLSSARFLCLLHTVARQGGSQTGRQPVG